MNQTADCFSGTYADARAKFLDAAHALGLSVDSHPHPLAGRDNEALAMDVVIDGDPAAENLLILSSGCHGIEGFAGSGVQIAMLHDEALRTQARSASVTLIHIHALNPYGFSYWRRNTQENVDLNRNFQDFSRPLPRNAAFLELHPILSPADWPPSEHNQAAMLELIQRLGVKALQSVVAHGQHDLAEGLFFGGSEPCWSNLTLRKVLHKAGGHARRIAWIDIHTGLGPSGSGELILACQDATEASARARAWWGPGVTSIHDDSSVSSVIIGPMWTALPEECPNIDYTGIAIEFGTVPVTQVLQALRADNWLFANRDAPTELRRRIASQMRDAFLVDTVGWKQAVLNQSRTALVQAITGLAASPHQEVVPAHRPGL